MLSAFLVVCCSCLERTAVPRRVSTVTVSSQISKVVRELFGSFLRSHRFCSTAPVKQCIGYLYVLCVFKKPLSVDLVIHQNECRVQLRESRWVPIRRLRRFSRPWHELSRSTCALRANSLVTRWNPSCYTWHSASAMSCRQRHFSKDTSLRWVGWQY